MAEKNDNLEQEKSEESVETTMATRIKDAGFWKEMWYQIRLVWFLIRDPEVPFYLKALPFAALIYLLIPTDFIPDFFPGFGQLDDLTALILGGKVFIEMAPQHVVARYVQSLQRNAEAIQDEDTESELQPADMPEVTIIEGDFEEMEENNQNGSGLP